MNVGFTGTQMGMIIPQEEAVRAWLQEHKHDIKEFHHGDCVGADWQAHNLVTEMYCDEHLRRIIPHIHPPINSNKRAWCQAYNAVLWDPQEYLKRNKIIVEQSDIMLAAPKGYEEELRSGTWATIRYARATETPHIIFWPNGSTSNFSY